VIEECHYDILIFDVGSATMGKNIPWPSLMRDYVFLPAIAEFSGIINRLKISDGTATILKHPTPGVFT